MVSFEQKPLLLVAFLLCFIHLTTGQLGNITVPGIPVPPNTSIPPRQEINTFIKDPICLNLLLLGLSCLQTTNINQPLSYYQLAGIHGTGIQWNGDNGGDFGYSTGYCHHNDELFPTWHRPFLSLFEMSLYNCARTIVNTFPAGTQKNQYLASLQTCRLPYWDWAKNITLPSIISTIQNVVVTTVQNGKYQNVTMHNPLYSCPTNRNDPNTMVAGSSTGGPYTDETVRQPYVPSKKLNVYASQPSVVASSMSGTKPTLKSVAYKAFSASTTYSLFATTANEGRSIEGPHNTVHVNVGGNIGHMGIIEYAGFDPLFWLHHCNIDRLFALWQACYPDSYLTNDTSVSPNADTELHPFQRTPNVYWTSTSVRDPTVFGYTYPELNNCNESCMKSTINNLYGTGSSKKKRGVATDSSTYYEYEAHFKISNAAAYGSYTTYCFLGDPSTSEDDYATDPNYVGSFDVFAHRNMAKSHKKMVNAAVSMTEALSKLVDAGILTDMTPERVQDYVKENFRWRITGGKNGDYDLDGLKIAVVAAKVKPRKDQYSFPVWGKYSPVYQVV